MLPATPTADWNIVPDRRRIISPDDSELGTRNNRNNDNPFRVLDNSDDDSITDSEDEVPTGVTVRTVEPGNLIYSDTGAGDHIISFNRQYISSVLEQFRDHSAETTASISSLPSLHTHVEDDDTASTSSLSTCGSMGKDTLPSIDDFLSKEYQSATRSNYNYADAVVFREELGNGLERCQHTTRDAGHAYMVDTPQRHKERFGDTTAILPPPAQKVDLPTSDASGAWRRYETLKRIYDREMHWNAEILQAIVRRFPTAMKEQTNDYGAFPLNYTAREALIFVESKVSDRVKKQKAYIDIMEKITSRAYVPSADGPVAYLKAMEHDKHCIDILSSSSTVEFEYSWETLIINCQSKIRSSGKHNNTYLRLIEDRWESDVNANKIGRWKRFKTLYIEELQKLVDDGIDNNALSTQQALIARVDAFESKYESEVQTLNNNQLHLETAFQASSVPSMVETDGTGTVSGSISGTAASGMQSMAMSDLLREMRAMKAELSDIKAGGKGDKKKTTDALYTVWRQWKFWCHSCGCNLNHDSEKCKSARKKKGHKNEATIQNPMGGNTAKDAFFNKWWNPADHKPYDKPE